MVADHLAASILLKQYPTRLKVVRYEDLSLDAYEMTRDILSFYKLPFDEEVQEFLDSHTKLDYGGVSSTFRDSKSVPFHWTKDLKFEEVSSIVKLNRFEICYLVGHFFHLSTTIIDYFIQVFGTYN